MKETIFEQVASAASVLKLDLSAEEFALFAEDREFSEAGMEAVQMLLGYLSEKKQQTTIQTLLKMSRLPTKAPKTFENFDFSLLKGKDVERLKVLSSLNAIYSHRNLAFIGPAGTGKTHLAQAFGYACCQHGLKTYVVENNVPCFVRHMAKEIFFLYLAGFQYFDCPVCRIGLLIFNWQMGLALLWVALISILSRYLSHLLS